MRGLLTAVSLFSGAGGMDVGFTEGGFDILFANDIDKAACETFNLNHEIKSSCGDLRDFKTSLSQFKDVDLVFGGPPCQGFSVAGKMDPLDKRSELIWTFLEQVKSLDPKAFVCENVKSLAVNNRWRDVRDRLIETANGMGYATSLVVLNASHFGVPQARERMFLIGVKDNVNKVSSQEFGQAISKALNSRLQVPVTISELFRSLGPAGSENNNRTCSAIISYAKKPVLRRSPYAGMLFNGSGRPINPQKYALTLPASMGGNKTPIIDEEEIFLGKSSFVVNYHEELRKGGTPRSGIAPSRLRRITVDEALAIQTFPPGYRMAGSQSSIYRQIGNAVPCKLAKVVAEVVNQILIDGLYSFVGGVEAA